jgi:hypothetical protein
MIMAIRRVLFLVLASTFALQCSAATIVIQVNDGPGEGFNDPNPPRNANQKGSNPGTSLGEMRMELFKEAAKVWGDIVNSTETISIGAEFNDLGCFGNSALLGQAGPTSTKENFGSGDANIAYAVALAESLSSSNQNGASVEINAEFNSKVDSDITCLGGGGFYYGLDGNVPDGTTALFSTVLHELGHGLGFLSYVTQDGSWLNGTMDPYSRLLMDLQTGKSWADMSDLERSNSLLNEPNLVWTGAKVTEDRTLHLDPTTELKINAPAPAGTSDANLGQQSPAIPGGGLAAAVVDGNSVSDLDGPPFDGCSQFTFTQDAFTGKIVLFDKTAACPVVIQVLWAQREAAVGVIIAETSGVELADVSGLLNGELTIPYIGTGKAEADQLRTNIGVANVTFQNSTTKLMGENQGKLKMYAPLVLSPGSSVSHWSETATPDLLMEPSSGTLIYQNVDLTAAAFQDIGWSVNIPGAQLELIYKDGFENP